jgi:DNA-binding CsgD family transcriptional regulator
MAQVGVDIIERLARTLATRTGSLTEDEGAEFGRALTELADRIQRAAELLRELVELVNPQALPTDLHLTARELEMLGHLAEGRTNAEIAKQCWITENTVKFHLKNLFRKLGVRDRGQAMMIARAARGRLGQPFPRTKDGHDPL